MIHSPYTSLDQRESDLFRGRTEVIETIRARLRDPLRPEVHEVLSITGVGGIGKSALARSITRELQVVYEDMTRSASPDARPVWAAIDVAETWATDTVTALLQIRLQLGMTWRTARFPVFDYAFARLHAERYPSSDILQQYDLLRPDNSLVTRIARDLPQSLCDSKILHDTATAIRKLVEDLPHVEAACNYANQASARGREFYDRRTIPLLQEVGALGADRLEQRLPECLGLDIRNAIRTDTLRRPVFIIVDTVEAFHAGRAHTGGIGAAYNDLSLRELVWRAPGVTFVLLGRDPLPWADYETSSVRDWARLLTHAVLPPLPDADVEAILEAFPVDEPEIRAAIRDGAGGLPFYLALQLDIYRDLRDEDITPTLDDFATAPKGVVTRFISHIGERLAVTLTTLAHCRRFDAALFQHLKEQPGHFVEDVHLSEITHYSLVEGNAEDGYHLHQLFQDIERARIAREDPDWQARLDTVLFTYWDARCQPKSIRTLTPAHEMALIEAFHHRRLANAPEELADWLASRMDPFWDAYSLLTLHSLWKDVLKVVESSGIETTVTAALTLGNLGLVLERLDDLAGARAAQERALEIFEAVHGPEHTEVAQTLRNLGKVLERLDDLSGARAAQERALEIFEAVYGPDHAEVARTLGNLGNVLERLYDLSGARRCQERALAINEAVYGGDHAAVAQTLGNLGLVLSRLDDLAGARAAQERALEINEVVYGPGHAQVALTLGNLGNVLERLDDLAGARAAQERALEINEAVYGPENTQVAQTLVNLGSILCRLDDLVGAKAAIQRAVAIFEAVYGMENASVALGLNNLGNILFQLDDLAGARAAQERALAIFEAVYGRDHAQVALTLGNLGTVLSRLDDLPGARAALDRALAINEAVYGRDHPVVALTLGNLGNVLERLGDLSRARDAQERALAINEAVYGRDHASVAQTLVNLGNVLERLGDLSRARDAKERALAINEAVYGRDHASVAQTLVNLGNVLERLGDLSGARDAQERALAIFERVLGPQHTYTVITSNNLRMLAEKERTRVNE